MNIYNGIYSWDGKRHGTRDPVAWFPGAYNLQISHLAESNQTITYLKPYICIYSETGQGHSISANPEKFAKHVCTDFGLELDRVLWVEKIHRDGGRYEIIVFTKSNRLGDNLFYQLSKRPPTDAELSLIVKVQEHSVPDFSVKPL